MPCMRYASKDSVAAPNAGLTSSRAFMKSAAVTLMLSSSSGLCRSSKSTLRLRAYATASLTRPSISAPLKFLVDSASFSRSTSRSRNELDAILLVWILRICSRPFSSGSPTSICTSRRPGRSSASSSMSLRLVIPMSRMLLRASTPSILVSSWLTTVSCTPEPSRTDPRDLHIASISSKMMMCSSESSPLSRYSASASANRLRMFSSVWPTYLFRTSGPLTTFGSFPLSILPIWRAMSVLPVPGGPYSSIPFTCLIPSLFTMLGGNTRDANARRKMASNCLSRPPIPSCSKLICFDLNSCVVA
mmetsp:Transcript_20864/g.62363  ORF Transcript_20864/g.62363 Transcript_20864/m.62363 type:complete len:303 (-) Transcript_20864:1220-2128(-)